MEKLFSLKSGDTIGICAPSARFDTEKLNTGIQILKNLGFKVKVPEEIFGKKRYLAGNDRTRAGVINQFFSDSRIDGIICARGGFGAMRILDFLNWTVIKQNPKPFIGFSDITAILLSIIGKTGNRVIHGPNVVSFATASQETIDSFYNAVSGFFDKIEIIHGKIIHAGTCTGLLKGGNIATIAHLLGTRFQPDFKNTILFLEDIGEPAYKIDRMLTQMKMAGLFEGIQGVVTGAFENCANDEYLEEILHDIFEGYRVPILSGIDSGHGKVNLSLGMGTRIKMSTNPSTLEWV